MSPKSKPSKTAQLRRNERERKRVHQVNDGFDLLRLRVPKAVANKKLSKADTLREAVKYIKYLQNMLTNDFSSLNDFASSPCQSSAQSRIPTMEELQQQSQFYSEMDNFYASSSSQKISPTSSMMSNYPLNTSSCSSNSSNGHSPATMSVTSSPDHLLHMSGHTGIPSYQQNTMPQMYQYHHILPSAM